MNFEQIVQRVRQMQHYGLSLAEIHDLLKEDGVPEDVIFFAYKGAEYLNEETQ